MMLECSEPSNQTPSDFPYFFTEDGHLCHRDTMKPYKFSFKLNDVHGTVREHLTLCRCITQHVCSILEKKLKLVKVHLDKRTQADSYSLGFVYTSPGALNHHGTLMVLIQDKGTVRCGVWSWRAVAREGLDRGSQIPYVRWALEKSCAVLLMNPNEGGLSPEEHVRLVWERLVSKSAAERITVVAHGYGGLAFVHLLCHQLEEIRQRVWAVALIDSSHNQWHQPLGAAGRDWLKAHSRTWILSTKPTNRPVGSLKAGCRTMSAGTQCHETAPAVCMEAVFRFFAKVMRPKAVPAAFGIITRSRSFRGSNPNREAGGTNDRNNNTP
ncbi:cotranscriptional regulator FAM172A homolog [Colossoma macropomum]|uniref:cotranscriptional regulator FAM172A homolog n=1 Tax=Colossoma macropomum TaxID=42526 RepID=UPI001864B369|nr:cotranscriptional regulator FAM172A homolog [Colossoma macropomum]XP_036413443.1 cotranscriptional regulator FAM172A homolog [Colossoma macropomum]